MLGMVQTPFNITRVYLIYYLLYSSLDKIYKKHGPFPLDVLKRIGYAVSFLSLSFFFLFYITFAYSRSWMV